MKVLIFDTETTGLPTERNPSIRETAKWPHIIQLSYIVYDTDTISITDWSDDIIKLSDDVVITKKSTQIHGITRSMSKRKGVSLIDALQRFNRALQDCDRVVGHNISFDKRMIMVESIRLGIAQYFTINGRGKPEQCTMKANVEICKIETTSRSGEKYFKYPTLTELHGNIFQQTPKGMHDSMADVLICARCYGKLNHDHDVIKDGCAKFKFFHKTYCR
tara:strand:- start:5900 stop:6556 length:657 start_codon:yes stop_codon:yes gene_type:complete